jgi:hypothetical protein
MRLPIVQCFHLHSLIKSQKEQPKHRFPPQPIKISLGAEFACTSRRHICSNNKGKRITTVFENISPVGIVLRETIYYITNRFCAICRMRLDKANRTKEELARIQNDEERHKATVVSCDFVVLSIYEWRDFNLENVTCMESLVVL